MSHHKGPNEVKEDVYIVAKPQYGKWFEAEPSRLDKMLKRFVGRSHNTAPQVNFEIPYLPGCFCVILGSKYMFNEHE